MQGHRTGGARRCGSDFPRSREPGRGRLAADAVFTRSADDAAVWLLQLGSDATVRRQLASQEVPERVSLCGERHVRVRTAAIHLAFREHLLRRVLDVQRMLGNMVLFLSLIHI